MALPISGAGYQFGSGNISEVEIMYTDAPTTIISANATVGAYDLTMGIVVTSSTNPLSITLPTATQLEAVLQGRAGLTFDTSFVNNGTSTIAVVANTGVTVIGSLITAATASARFRFRKVVDGTWVAYRLA